ncbi:MAG: amylo-alpha-1,6-glucosidase [Dehalococcoidia bacterium]
MPNEADANRIRAEAARILAQNRRTGHAEWNGQDYACVVPSPGSYPFQWLWDSCFHAIALTHVNLDWARQELETLLKAATPSGFIPHQILWEKDRFPEAAARQSEDFGDRYTSSSIQPPVLATALERVYGATRDRAFLERCLPPTVAFYRWLAEARDPDRDGLIAIIQPDESGVDASPKFDPLMEYPKDNDDLVRWIAKLYKRYQLLRFDDAAILKLDLFQVEEVLTNVCYVLGLQALSRLCDGDEAAEFSERAARVTAALVDKCYDATAGAFFDLAGNEESSLRCLTITSLAPLAIPTLDRSVVERLIAHLENTEEFGLPFPAPSVSKSEPSFAPGNARGFIWRGPSWINSNWLICEGLRAHGYEPLRRRIVDATCAMVLQSGFREYYNPFTAEGYGSRDHSWSTLVVDMIDGPVT